MAHRSVAEIPLVFLVSEKFKKLHGELFLRIKNAAKKPFVSEDLVHVLCDLAGISVADFDETRDVLSENYKPKKRIFLGEDYDKVLKNKF